ncbi:MAG: HIT family protein [Prolixibacteraceae bacterium]|jgi:histidine triad (HIT) family protein|nr:HIT family protein [Prolixibacteraceae bacterium]MBT6005149.1 HIT family protein [Prolixibacteraceae bacterium]MBT6764506.1 HIT family protein [Prolixibacteraceae bacterium]MBT6997334.1 HIT family protein [Prolixibacteraceae bacterium]MBT7397523.1 HIT family protein [Prolixibacteraceae bacterium]
MAGIFSKIVNGEIPAYKVAEDEDYLAFLDIFPVAKGHTLVIPKKEVDYLFDLDDELYTGLQLFAKKIAVGLKKAFPCEKVGVLVLGLDVPHAHIHLVPMQNEADLLNFSKKIKFTPEEFKKISELISNNIE